ncbi:YeeE/YedE family protein [Klebsiella quasipneumoniae subsp. similipneumoniae]|uniref:YeeE/YedE family protein n=1 Tax=Klebsiella quasipneumoniae subsp. similipneumoniae TaxID=1463164 RepID=A0AAE4MX98_9ENTR|nr:YeeE/YedE family protein [Klebsiella quasipneumoniae]HBY2478906.1 YeeE/YedE family protein [Klebsiella pneumoniae]HDT5885753.1 YeeE/YedE family protein [Klebsiella pneumoniae subsp. pneumoniae]MDV0614614.1 YeeE/YedE family protein [Klebsiella quasipneumoniae subsp. similipneumoniae]MDV0642378.1 YeeE/YedE family protein [Klebsiella quasipneumoniae subsp. similipneumoniae]MDV0729515.1 YeeE/YedE family protein [Klebsiella quasipneumoniae subsp. similipneumoniae]
MTINLVQFTPFLSFLGGVLIGCATWILLLFCGRIAGISGILGGVLSRGTPDRGWRLAFLVGIIISPLLYALVYPLPAIEVSASWPILIIAGLLVGIGTRYGSGCTSGHGVCGLSRLSPRSLVATLTFMAVAFITVWLMGLRI